MLEDLWKHALTLLVGSGVWLGLLKFFGRRELNRMDDAVEKLESKADGPTTVEALEKCADRLAALEAAKPDRQEIVAAVSKLERTIERQEKSRAAIYARFDKHVAELHSVDSRLQNLVGRLDALHAAGVLPRSAHDGGGQHGGQ